MNLNKNSLPKAEKCASLVPASLKSHPVKIFKFTIVQIVKKVAIIV